MSDRVVSREEWTAARKELLEDEKRLTRLRDELSARRRALPRVEVVEPYVFEGPDGPETLADLFGGKGQLVVQHFMFSPAWEEGCIGCSFMSDHIEGALRHLRNRDVSFVRISRAPYAKLRAFRERMGWTAKWVSSFGTRFNYDYHVSFEPEAVARGEAVYNFAPARELPEEVSGFSVFAKDEAGRVYHTYSSYARGDEGALTAYFLLDLTPNGRQEDGPHRNLMDWVRHHDRYDAGFVDVMSLYRTGRLEYEPRT